MRGEIYLHYLKAAVLSRLGCGTSTAPVEARLRTLGKRFFGNLEDILVAGWETDVLHKCYGLAFKS